MSVQLMREVLERSRALPGPRMVLTVIASHHHHRDETRTVWLDAEQLAFEAGCRRSQLFTYLATLIDDLGELVRVEGRGGRGRATCWRIPDLPEREPTAQPFRSRARGPKQSSIPDAKQSSIPDDRALVNSPANSPASRTIASRVNAGGSSSLRSEQETTPSLRSGGPGGEKVVKFAGKPVAVDTLDLAERILDDFNDQNDSSYSAFTGRGQPSEALKRILGALVDAAPPLYFDEASGMIRWRLPRPFNGRSWDSKPHPGVVFGSNVFEGNRQSAASVTNGRERFSEYDRATRTGA